MSGSSNGAMTLYRAETASITVSDGTLGNGGGTAVTVSPAPASTFSLAPPSSQTAGAQFAEAITARDAYGNTATGYDGAKTVSFSGPGASPNGQAPIYPAAATYTSQGSNAWSTDTLTAHSAGFTDATVLFRK